LVVFSTALFACAEVSKRPATLTFAESVVPEIAKQFSACNLEALLANYSTAVEYVSPSTPKPLVGRSELREHFSGACRGQVRAVMQVEAQRVRMLSSDSAVITGTYSFGRTDLPADKPWPAFFVITLQQNEGRWLVNTQATFPIPEN
jgi:ketosteroid isomerase-like protein